MCKLQLALDHRLTWLDMFARRHLLSACRSNLQKRLQESDSGEMLGRWSRCKYQPLPACTHPTCRPDPLLTGLLDRVAKITNSTRLHLGPIELRQYEVGEYSQAYIDQIHFEDPQLPEGPVVWVVLMFLNTPEDGGEEQFPDVEDARAGALTVRAAQGSAILFPALDNLEMDFAELWTYHQSMRVNRGVKFVAQVNVYQHDYQTPRVVRRCDLGTRIPNSISPRRKACMHQFRHPKHRCIGNRLGHDD
jgi:hypothetical protein